MVEEFINDNHVDDHVDTEIINCINEKNRKSFFMFAGAGSGKTRSLVNLMNYLKDNEKFSSFFIMVNNSILSKGTVNIKEISLVYLNNN